MTTTITEFPLPPGIDPAELAAGFSHVAPVFAAVPGLIRKQFLVAADGTAAGGCYLWESAAHAEAFCEETLREMIRDRFGVECSIRHFDTPVVVEGPAAG